MKIISGKIRKYQKVVAYGPEGIGKSTFASRFPRPLFIDTEGSTAHLDVDRLERPSSWVMLMQYLDALKKDSQGYQTLVIDTVDWAEHLCVEYICKKYQHNGIEDFGYGKGYMYEKEEFGRLLNRLQDLVDTRMNVVLTAHAMVRKFERPDQPPYDRYELKLNKAGAQKISDMVKEWADMLLFANYKEEVYKVDSKDGSSKKTKVVGGQRVMYTSHHPNWDAKNRHGLAECLPFEFAQIAHCVPSTIQAEPTGTAPTSTKPIDPPQPSASVPKSMQEEPPQASPAAYAAPDMAVMPGEDMPAYLKPLYDLMAREQITEEEIRQAVASRGYFPEDMPIEAYPEDFVSGCLVAAFPTIVQVVNELRERDTVPF